MSHHHSIHLFHVHRLLVLADVESTGIDFTGDLLDLHAVAGTGQEVDYGFFEFHNMQMYRILRNFAVYK